MFSITSKNQNVILGYSQASMILQSEKFRLLVAEFKNATYSDLCPIEVANKVKKFIDDDKQIYVSDYYYKSASVVGMTKKDGKNEIFVNSYKSSHRTIKTYLRNAVHEFAHLLGLGHGSNFTQYTFKGRMMCRLNGDFENKELSWPYMFEKFAIEIYEGIL